MTRAKAEAAFQVAWRFRSKYADAAKDADVWSNIVNESGALAAEDPSELKTHLLMAVMASFEEGE